MPLSTDLSRSPFFDDFDPTKDYYRVLFKPGFAVQARELNQLQSILQEQVERFGDAVFKTGTIVEGCNFQFYAQYPYAKIRDLDTTGVAAVPADYVGLFLTSTTTGLRAFVTDYADGYEASAPDLKTLYLRYNNAGTNGNTHAFTPGEVVQVTDANNSVFSVSVTNTGVGFTNADFVVITPAVAVTVTSGSFSNGDYVTQPSTGANLQVVGVDTTTLASAGQVVLRLKARTQDLSAVPANSSAWAVANSDSIKNSTNTAAGTVAAVLGAGAAAAVVTDGSGRVLDCPVTSGGWGYRYVAPQAQVYSANNASVASAVLVAQNWMANLVVANTADAIGNGYAFGVSDGVVYQKGHFLRVDAQSIVVSKYSETPSNVAVAFSTLEDVVTSSIDTSLLDNALGSENYTAPGADRLRLTPQLSLTTPDDTSSLVLCAWSEGLPYKQNQATDFSRVGDAIATAVDDVAGDFSVDQFMLTTRSPRLANQEGSTLSLVVDPGLAYVDGYRVQTQTNYVIDVDKGVDSLWSNNQSVTLAYGQWVRVDNLAGVFQFSTGDVVTLYSAPTGYLSSMGLVGAGSISPAGSAIGTARVRSWEWEQGQPGQPSTTYLLYLFDVQMSQGKNFRDVRAIGYSGTRAGIADVVLEPDPTTGASVAVLHQASQDALLFDLGADAAKTVANVSYVYRTIDQAATIANTGVLTKSLAGDPSASFAQRGAPLTAAQMKSLTLVPATALQYAANVTGTVAASTTSANLTGTGTSFLTDLAPGDYVYVYANSTVHDVRRVAAVVNNTIVTLDANCAFAQSGVALYRYYPAGVPVPLGWRAGLSANTDGPGDTLTIDLGGAFVGSANAALVYDVSRTNPQPATKTAVRSSYVKVSLANNAGGVVGPWCLGVPDLVRVRGVWRGSNSSVTPSTGTDVSDEFYADNGQNPAYLDLAWLYKSPGSGVSLSGTDWLLVSIDYLQSSGAGYFCAQSYVSSNSAQAQLVDSTSLADLSSSVASLEVPEVYASARYWDLLDCLDFRPVASSTCAPSADPSTAPVNPVYALGFGNTADPSADKKFPAPGYTMTLSVEQYMGRVDSVFVGHDGAVFVARGAPARDPAKRKTPNQPRGSMRINDVSVPPWPTYPVHLSLMEAEVAHTRVKCDGQSGGRVKRKTAQPMMTVAQVQKSQPRRYTMSDVGSLEDRIQALEYYTSLSALETDMTKRVIPSSANTSVNRFKFGFFVDDFSTTTSQAASDPQYAATVAGGLLLPPSFSWTVSHGVQQLSPPWVEQVVVSQDVATYHPAPPPPPVTNTAPPAVNAAPIVPSVPVASAVTTNASVTVLNTYSWYTSTMQYNPTAIDVVTTETTMALGANIGSFSGTKVDRVTFGENDGVATLYFYVPPTVSPAVNVINLNEDPATFLVYQEDVLVADAGTSAVNTTSSETDMLFSASGPGPSFFPIDYGSRARLAQYGLNIFPPVRVLDAVDGHNTVSGWGKISWTHQSAAGRDYTVVSNLLALGDQYWWALYYPSGQVVTSTAAPRAQAMAEYTAGILLDPPVMTLELDSTSPAAQVATLSQTLTTSYVNAQTGTQMVYGDSGFSDYVTYGFTYSRVTNVAPSPTAALRPQAFACFAWGLVPGTNHRLTVQGIDKTARCRPAGGGLGDPLRSGSDGTLSFQYYYDALLDQDLTAVLVTNPSALVTNPTGGAAGVVQDGSLKLVLSAPNSQASYELPVYDTNVPLNYLKNR